jgi:nucleoside-diphosphate-sugar epimerase
MPESWRVDDRDHSETVLVTGAHGAIGSWVVRELVERGRHVVRLDIGADALTPFPELAAAPFVAGDIRETGLLDDVLGEHRVGRIVHLAAIITAEDDPALAIEVNALATARLLDLAAARGVRRVVAMSTKGVLGPLGERYLHPHYEPVPVDHPLGPRTVYESTKHLVEVAAGIHRARGADVAVVRLASTWGPGKTSATHGAFGLHGDVLAAALRGESSRLDVHPEQGYDLIYHADVAAGLADLVLAPGPLREPVYHLGSGRVTTIREFAEAVEAAFPGVHVEPGDRFTGGRQCVLDIAPAARDAGYVPAWDAARALANIRDLAAAGIVR